MNRREAIKAAGATVMSTVLAPGVITARERDEAPRGAAGKFIITFRGPSILFFPRADAGAKAQLHFTHFPYDPVCPQPTHITEITITSAGTTCARFGDKDSLRLAGLHLRPVMLDPFKPRDYADVPSPAKGSPAMPAGTDWSSLKWVPKLTPAIDTSALEDATLTHVALDSGELVASEPHDPLARNALWIWANQAEWAQAELNLGDAPQSAATDVIQLKGRYENGKAVIKVGTLLDPSVAFDLEFEQPDGQDIAVTISAEPPSTNHEIQARPHILYCAYYNVAKPAVKLPDRVLPYLSPRDFQGKVQAPSSIHGGYQPTPRPLCGTMRVIE